MNRRIIALGLVLLLGVGVFLLYQKSRTGLDELPNMIQLRPEDFTHGSLFSYGSENEWPGGTPTHCDDLSESKVVDLELVGFLTDIESDLTGSLGQVGPSGAIKVYRALRSPPRDTTVIVAEPSQGCFVVYSPMV